ncbi:Acetyltransferase (GNAT) family Acetyltransferase (GNAT) domain [Trypanosoma vivax]|uniref:Putative N-acetyltransferase n=1 Tax=Trypanosoma vivax (strain Y486) TaxID=1055687 RepID=G0TY36_TRYVY|nr:putative N-acetyltransferase [Trypanosoma vivax]KAH8618830.1 Acetyltransferase (GNAT) family Acetyltransferase (GNAT) domain [Trypanosoma vivax]CCC48881.1 putative N-acetyltransferase [Trypanosoma vivax Y486]
MPKRSHKKDNKTISDEAINALVEAIEGASFDQKPKKGMTRKQEMALREKQIEEAIDKARGEQFKSQEEERQLCRSLLVQRLIEESKATAPQHHSVVASLKEEHKAWQEVAPNKFIRYEQFDGSDDVMDFVVQLFTKELTEPYSSFTYEYFVFGWPDLTVIAYGYEGDTAPDPSVKGERVGAVVSRVSLNKLGTVLRGYVAMFAVIPSFRGFRLGSRLVALTIELMREKQCAEVYLETPTSNSRALSLYLSLGFVKTKFLPRYYLDHSDAVRLKLWLTDAIPTTEKQVVTTATKEEIKP